MADTGKTAVARHRRRKRRQGFVRVEMQVRKGDAPLLRRLAGALADPEQATQARAFLRQHFARRGARGLKALLADAPLEGIALDRARDPGRAVEL